MRARTIHQEGGQRTYAVVLESGDELMASLQSFAASQQIYAAQVTGIGAFSRAVLMYFDWEKRAYQEIPIDDQVEVASLVGDIAEAPSKEPSIHIHLVLGRRDGTAMAGHLSKGYVRPTLELIVTESRTHLRKRKDPESGLALINPEA